MFCKVFNRDDLERMDKNKITCVITLTDETMHECVLEEFKSKSIGDGFWGREKCKAI